MPLPPDELRRIDASWRAANYLAAGQSYLLDNPLLREPLLPEHVKPRMVDEKMRHRIYTREHGEDAPDVRGWTWTQGLKVPGPRGLGPCSGESTDGRPLFVRPLD